MWGKPLAAMLAIYTSKGVAPEVYLREPILCMPLPSANKAAHSGFEAQRRCHQKSETGVSVAPQWTCVQKKIFKKRRKCYEWQKESQYCERQTALLMSQTAYLLTLVPMAEKSLQEKKNKQIDTPSTHIPDFQSVSIEKLKASKNTMSM